MLAICLQKDFQVVLFMFQKAILFQLVTLMLKKYVNCHQSFSVVVTFVFPVNWTTLFHHSLALKNNNNRTSPVSFHFLFFKIMSLWSEYYSSTTHKQLTWLTREKHVPHNIVVLAHVKLGATDKAQVKVAVVLSLVLTLLHALCWRTARGNGGRAAQALKDGLVTWTPTE